MSEAAVSPSDTYLHARGVDGRVDIEGARDVFLGHRIDEGSLLPGGNWVEWHWDGSQVSVTNDAHGAYPVYYAATDDSFAISPSIDRLLALGTSRELDLDALSAFLAIGYYLATDTAFRAVRALPPAATVTWRPGQLSVDSDAMVPETVEMSRDAAIDGVIDLMRTAVGRRIPVGEERFIMPVSGGRDSRHILVELLRRGHSPVRCVTTHHHANDWGGDPPFAERLCRELGLPHETLQPGPLVGSEWRKNRLTSYGADEHAWYLPVADALNGATQHTYDGLGAAVVKRAFMTRRARELSSTGRWDELAAWMGKKDDGKPRFTDIIAPEIRTEMTAERAAGRIRDELQRHLAADEPLLLMYLQNRVARELSLIPNALLSAVPNVFTPFMDVDLMRFAASIPAEHAGKALEDEAITRAYPEVAGLPHTPKRRPQPDRRFLRQINRDLLLLLARHSTGALVDRRALSRRAALGTVSANGWFAWGRRVNLITYLVQLEKIVSVHDTGTLRHGRAPGLRAA